MKKPGKTIRDRRIVYIITAAAVVLIAAVIFRVFTARSNRTFSSYRVILSQDTEEGVSRYEYTSDGILRYSPSGAALLDNKLQAVWNVGYTMGEPEVDVCGRQILIYDRMGTTVCVCSAKKESTTFYTELPIVSARVSGRGTVAAILENGDRAELAYYEQSGSRIASGESTITDPGYPVSLDLTEDGYGLAVSYMTVNDGNVGSLVRFFDFHSGDGGGDPVSGEASFPGVLIPDLRYFEREECVLFRDNGFSVFRGISSPKETKTVNFDEEVVSVFCEDSHIGFVFPSDDKEHLFRVQTYSLNGNLQSEMYIDHSYDRVHVSGDQIVFSDSTSLSVYSPKGVCRFSGQISEGNIHDAVGIGRDRLMVVTDQSAEVICLV